MRKKKIITKSVYIGKREKTVLFEIVADSVE